MVAVTETEGRDMDAERIRLVVVHDDPLVRTGMGLILGRKAFKKSMADGVKLINAVQDVYLDNKVTIA